MAIHEVDGAHHHAGCAEAALQTVALLERRLHRMHRAVGGGEPLDRQHRGAVRLCGEDRAGLHRIAIEMHGAGAALAGIAADVRARERKLVPQEIDQQRARIDVRGDLLAVDGE